jgi:hypothetical protein
MESSGLNSRVAVFLTVRILLTASLAILFILSASGCRIFRGAQKLSAPTPYGDFIKEPGARMGSYPTSTVGTGFAGPDNLGKHHYSGSSGENNGIAFTCRAGHIDLAHLRKSADWTAFLAAHTYNNIKETDKHFTFRLKEDSVYHVKLKYPDYWKNLLDEEKERIARKISIEMGGYFAYCASTWHEILTWFGYKCSGLYSEYPSAFSWEDCFSNLLGCRIAMQALNDYSNDYNQAVTTELKRELEYLGITSDKIAKKATAKVRGDWFSGDMLFFVKMKKRNFDIGLDGYITPWTIAVSECENCSPIAYPTPNVDYLKDYGFSLKFYIEPREWQKKQIMAIAYPYHKNHKNIINPQLHFPIIMDSIETEGEEKYGKKVSKNNAG